MDGRIPIRSHFSFESSQGTWAVPVDCAFVIPAGSAGIQVDMDVSGRILRTWMPAIHAGMTDGKLFDVPAFHVPRASVSSKPLLRKASGEGTLKLNADR